MSSTHPILIFQMQRLGDVVLTFPLILWLSRRYPSTPIWVVAEKMFYEGLMAISPKVAYCPWDGMETLRKRKYSMVINLSIREEAAAMMAHLDAEEKLGPMLSEDGARRIQGQWQLYRAGLVHNNRHNLFHWADLNVLDCVPLQNVQKTTWASPMADAGTEKRVGLFLGASDACKRPPVAFWVDLVQQLSKRQLRPVLFGGRAETELGGRVRQKVGKTCLNLCGKFTLPEFINALRGVGLLITPDTGPMHLAAWMGLPTLNLSMGPVNPWETGPYQGGHHVLQPAMSCVGCWKCIHAREFACRELFDAGKVAYIAQRLAQNKTDTLQKLTFSGLRLFQTGRTTEGLFMLTRVGRLPNEEQSSCRDMASAFWTAFFGARFGLWGHDKPKKQWNELAQTHDRVCVTLRKALVALSKNMAKAVRDPKERLLAPSFWTDCPQVMRPLSGYLLPFLQNSDFSHQGFGNALAMLEELHDVLS